MKYTEYQKIIFSDEKNIDLVGTDGMNSNWKDNNEESLVFCSKRLVRRGDNGIWCNSMEKEKKIIIPTWKN